MLNNLLFVLTGISYIGLLIINLYKPKGTGDQLVGWSLIIFVVLTAYIVSSLMLTINIAYKGGFDWIAETKVKRNIIICIGWLCLMAGIYYTTSINVDVKVAGTNNMLGLIVVEYGAIWMPLLMLIPYAVMSNTEWHNTDSPNIYKNLLLTGCLIGLAFHFLPRELLGKLLKDEKAIQKLHYENILKEMQETTNVNRLLSYIDDKDVQLKEAALTSLKRIENIDSVFIEILNHCESNYDYMAVYAYMVHNEVKNPQLFIKPLNFTLERVATELELLQFDLEENQKYKVTLLHVDGICQVLDTRFKAYKNEFRRNMLRIQEELNKEPKPGFIALRNKYKTAVDKWLTSQ